MTSAIPAIEEGEQAVAGHMDEIKEANAAIAELMGGTIDMATPEGLETARKFMSDLATGMPANFPVEERSVAGVPVRIFVPQSVKGVYLHIHGGGFVLGVAAMNDVSNADIAKQCNVAVVSVDYRLAPEHPYPAGPDDCEAVANWVVENADKEFGASKILIGGESAGASLAATTLLRVRDRIGAIDRFVCANLSYGVYDLTGSPSARNAADDSLVLSRADMEAFGQLYIGDNDLEKRFSGDISPLYANLDGLPPALFTIGGIDPLLDDSLFMAARWQVAGNHSEISYFPDCPHGFDMFPTQAAKVARARQLDWMSTHLA
ncbi:MAG: alpha/beta hydrolase [Acidimicrobiales bacterium]